MSNQKLAQRSAAQKLIYDQQRSFVGIPMSMSTGEETNAIGSWKSRNQEDKKYSVFQENRTSNKSTSVAMASMASTRDRGSSNIHNAVGRSDKLRHQSVRNQEYLSTRSGVLPSQTNETLPFIS